jgi:hypothetical protein
MIDPVQLPRFQVSEDYDTYKGGLFSLWFARDEGDILRATLSWRGTTLDGLTLGDLNMLHAVIGALLARFDDRRK